VAELADALDLGSSGATRESSSLSSRIPNVTELQSISSSRRSAQKPLPDGFAKPPRWTRIQRDLRISVVNQYQALAASSPCCSNACSNQAEFHRTSSMRSSRYHDKRAAARQDRRVARGHTPTRYGEKRPATSSPPPDAVSRVKSVSRVTRPIDERTWMTKHFGPADSHQALLPALRGP
jgi:hypothetical protein